MSEDEREREDLGLGVVTFCLAAFWVVSCAWCGSCAMAFNYGRALPGESGGASVVAALCAFGALLALAATLLARAVLVPRLKAQLTGTARSWWEWLCVACLASVAVFAVVVLSF